MQTYWKELWGLVQQMGAEEVKSFDISLPPPKSVTFNEGLSTGVEIKIDDLDDSGGLLSYNGNQVLVYIPDQGNNLARVLQNPSSGKKFHVSHCKTLAWMESQNNNHRYVATNDTSGTFNLTGRGGTEEARGALVICKNCLKHLNYQDFLGRVREQNTIFRNFNLTEFFSTYSSLFKYPYSNLKRRHPSEDQQNGESTRQWSRVVEPSACGKCRVSLPGHIKRLDVDPTAQATSATILCADCTRRTHWRDAEPILKLDMDEITRERRKQGLLDSVGTWDEAYDLADPAFHGLLKIYQRQGHPLPEIGFPLTNDEGVVLETELALAWEVRRTGVVATTEEQSKCENSGWVVRTLAQALLDCREDG